MVYKVVDLFCGGGGASLAFREIDGFRVVGAVDVDESACASYRRNLSLDPLQADLRNVSMASVGAHFGFDLPNVDVVVGCPPCQSFSSLKRTSGRVSPQDADELLVTFVGHLNDVRPKFVVFENVRGLLNLDDGKYLDWFKGALETLGYGFVMDLVDSADYGVPQHRERIVGFAVKDANDEDLIFPSPTHVSPTESDTGTRVHHTVRDAIGKLPTLQAGDDSAVPDHYARDHQESTLDLIEAVPKDGGSRTEVPDEKQLACHNRLEHGAGNSYGRMAWDEPAPTLTTQCTTPSSGRFIHPSQDRGITPREAARLMTFPDDYVLPDTVNDASRLLGNAVPPTLVEVLLERFFVENDFLK